MDGRTRRRGPALEQPIYAAVLAELADRGFAQMSEVFKEPELRAALLQRVIEPMQRILRELVAAAVSRGEARPGALAPECLNAGPALLRQHFLEHGAPIPDAVTVAIVDNALMPMLRSRLA